MYSESGIRSGTLPTQPTCLGADQRRFGNIELGQTEHLSLYELEAADLPLGLAVRLEPCPSGLARLEGRDR